MIYVNIKKSKRKNVKGKFSAKQAEVQK